ncbi:MAG TPA: hypothetical protein VF278_02135 [Pirellulales bacterium]
MTFISLTSIVCSASGLAVAENETFTGAATRPSTNQRSPPDVTSKTLVIDNRGYTVYESTDPDSKTFCVVIPVGLNTVRGLFVNSNFHAGDSRGDWTFCHYYREFMHLHDFALVAANGTCPHTSALKGFHKALRAIGAESKHPELLNAPYVAVGFSAGGGFASTLMTYDNPLTITAPGPCGPGTPPVAPGSDVTITVDTGRFRDWKKLVFYDGAKSVGVVTKAPAQFTTTRLASGYHVFSVLGTDADGSVRTSSPVMVVVRAASATLATRQQAR